MNVFISYSTDDLDLVRQISREIGPYATVRYWDKSKEPGTEVWDSIFSWIDQSDVVLAVITDKTVSRAMSVGQEIGRAKAKGRKIVPFVSEGIASSELGCLNGVTYEPISRSNPAPAFERIKAIFMPKTEQATDDFNNALIILGIVVLVWLIFFRKN